MNEGILKHSLIWKRMFSDVEILKQEKSNQELPRLMKDSLSSSVNKKFHGSYSASKLQSYIDCPRKFYFNYVDKVFPDVLLEKDFDPMISGSILHEIIETFFKENWADKDFSLLTDGIVHKYRIERKLQLSIEILRERTLTFNHRAWNGIQFIRNLENLTGEKIDWKFEEPFEQSDPVKLKGRIDCVGISASHVFLLDFKSTEMSASSASEVVEFQAIQLWIYAAAAQKLFKEFGQKSIIMGYVVLDDASKSGLLTSDEEFVSKIKSDKRCKIHKFKEEFTHKFQDYLKTLNGLLESIEAETLFPPRPRKNSTCTYCEINKICVKSEMSYE
jgi:ATP-dependent helicase/DNAse subunit B